MILGTKGRYAVMAVIDIASTGDEKPINLSDIAARQEIPQSYLEQIFVKLRKNNIVKSVRGPGGGYCLNFPASDIKIVDIILASDEQIKITRCKNDGTGCMKKDVRCITHNLWEGLNEQISKYLGNISVADVCAGKILIK